MDEKEYQLICSLDEFPSTSQLSVTRETFAAIKRQLQHRYFRLALRRHRQLKSLQHYVARLDMGESMGQIARSVAFSPCMMARLLLEHKYGWSKTTVSNMLKEAMTEDAREGNARLHRRGLSEPEYTRVMQEIRECIQEDVHCSPLADRVRHNMGVEYEYLLLETLRNRQLVFESEEMLREKGLSKTPDVRLVVPIGVKNVRNGQLHVVNWIDSKAMFGDRHTHETENASQLQGYVNRYGPGMVIYWFGYVSQLRFESDIFVTDSFPSEISLPGAFDPLASVTRLKEGAEVKLQATRVQMDFDSDWNPITTCEL